MPPCGSDWSAQGRGRRWRTAPACSPRATSTWSASGGAAGRRPRPGHEPRGRGVRRLRSAAGGRRGRRVRGSTRRAGRDGPGGRAGREAPAARQAGGGDRRRRAGRPGRCRRGRGGLVVFFTDRFIEGSRAWFDQVASTTARAVTRCGRSVLQEADNPFGWSPSRQERGALWTPAPCALHPGAALGPVVLADGGRRRGWPRRLSCSATRPVPRALSVRSSPARRGGLRGGDRASSGTCPSLLDPDGATGGPRRDRRRGASRGAAASGTSRTWSTSSSAPTWSRTSRSPRPSWTPHREVGPSASASAAAAHTPRSATRRPENRCSHGPPSIGYA